MTHPRLPDGTEGPHDLTLDDMIAELTTLRQKHGNLPVMLYWSTGRYDECHWKGQVSYIFIDRKEDEKSPSHPDKEIMIAVY